MSQALVGGARLGQLAVSTKRTCNVRTQFRGTPVVHRAPIVARPRGRGGAGPVVAIFDFFGPKFKADATYICVDCGFIYDGDFTVEPNSYKCPYCTSTKKRFKEFKGPVRGRAANSPAARQKRFKEQQW
ncbi:hypothetical protein BSKO_00143 [Bryopsis sp. KO-2023]|nr:hypothetical protein BSKO_00143 [Bryopsis sp. KO-2023]